MSSNNVPTKKLKKRKYRKDVEAAVREGNRKRALKRDKRDTYIDVIRAATDECNASINMLVYDHPTKLSPEQIIFIQEFQANGYKYSAAIESTFGSVVDGWSIDKKRRLAKKNIKVRKSSKLFKRRNRKPCRKITGFFRLGCS